MPLYTVYRLLHNAAPMFGDVWLEDHRTRYTPIEAENAEDALDVFSRQDSHHDGDYRVVRLDGQTELRLASHHHQTVEQR